MDYLEFFSIFYYFLFLKVTVHPYPVSCQGTPDIFTSWWRHFAYKLLILLKFEFSTPKLLRMQNFRFLVVLVTELVNWITFAPPSPPGIVWGHFAYKLLILWKIDMHIWIQQPKIIQNAKFQISSGCGYWVI